MLDKIAQIYGVDPSHFRQLLKLDKTVTERTVSDKPGHTNFSRGLGCFICVLMSIPVVLLADTSLGAFNYSLISLSYTMVMIAFLSYSRLEIVFNPTDYIILAHTPVSSRTFFSCKVGAAVLFYSGNVDLLEPATGYRRMLDSGTKPVISGRISTHLPHRRVFQRWFINGDYRLFDKTLFEQTVAECCPVRRISFSHSLSVCLCYWPSFVAGTKVSFG